METFRKLEEEISQYCKDNSISPEEHPEIVDAARHFFSAGHQNGLNSAFKFALNTKK